MQRRPLPLSAKDFQRLVNALAGQPAGMLTLTLTLAEIEAILGRPLPRAASTRAWWIDQGKHARHRRLLMAAGWAARAVHFRGPVPSVTFVKAAANGEVTP